MLGRSESGATIAGTKPETSPSRPSRYALRHKKQSVRDTVSTRQYRDQPRSPTTLHHDAQLCFVHRRRQPASTISRRLTRRVSVRISIPTVSYQPAHLRAALHTGG